MSGMLLPNRDGSSSPSFNLSTLNEGDSKELGLDDTELGILADHKQGEGHGMRHRNTSSSSGFHVDGDGNRISRALSKLMEKHLAPVNDLSVEQDADTATLLSSSSSRALSTQDQHHLHPHSHAHHMTPLEKKLMFSYESLDYDTVTNDLFHRDRPRSKESITSEWRVRWLLFGLIGFFTGTLAMALSYCTHHLVEVRP